jgi:hypothetical protein
MLRRISGTRKDDVIGGWRQLHNELHHLYSSPSTIRITSRKMRQAEHVACMERR